MSAGMTTTEPILAWRAWRLRGSGPLDALPVLESCVYGDEWPAQQAFRAGCSIHASPTLACGCGIYAVKTREAALAWARWARSALPNPIIYGQVHLWGTIVDHSDGYRAERAYPYELQLLDDDRWQDAARRTLERDLRARYAVDVVASAFAAGQLSN